jgi:putative transposase
LILDQLPGEQRVPIAQACAALGVARSSLYARCAQSRETQQPGPATVAQLPVARASPRALPTHKRLEIRDLLNCERFADRAPREVYAALLDEGRYVCSVSTMYRVLADAGQSQDRRAQRRHPKRARPELCASRALEVLTWDITYLPGPQPGMFFYAYLMIDLFSRYMVGWMVCECERAEHSQTLIATVCARHGIAPNATTLHADNGAPMKAHTVKNLLRFLGVAESHSRPHTSNDNAHSEAINKTLKYHPDCPKRFESVVAAQDWLRDFERWYNHEHHHVSLALMTPAQVFTGQQLAVQVQRQAVLDSAFDADPQRFVAGRPIAALPPAVVYINKPTTTLLSAPSTLNTPAEVSKIY